MRCLVVMMLLISTPVLAAEPVPAWSSHRNVADWISTGLVGVQLGADTIKSLKYRDNRRGALLNELCRVGTAVGLAELGKRAVNRERPDGSDSKSWPSMHTAILDSARGWNFGLGWSFTLGGGYLRSAANKHYPSDVASGVGVGEVSQWICKGVGA